MRPEKTLILEPDPMRARQWALHFGGPQNECDTARSSAQARLMLISGLYDRLCMTVDETERASYALLSVARAINPDCEIVDLASLSSRSASGPGPKAGPGASSSQGSDTATAPDRRPLSN